MDTALFLLVILVSCIFQGVVGFGFALIAVPISLSFLPGQFVIPSMTIASLPLNIFLVSKIRQKLDLGFIARLIVSGLFGMPVGIYILDVFTPWQIKLFAAVISISTTLIVTFFHVRLSSSEKIDYIAGFIAGILTTSVNINGAPIAALFLGRGLKRDKFRRTIAVYFLLMSLFSFIFFSSKLAIFLTSSYLSALIAAAALTGGALGNIIGRFIKPDTHKYIALATIILTSIYSLL